MDYKSQEIPLNDFPKIGKLPIVTQEQIEEKFGQPLHLTKVIGLIKEATDNYEKDDTIAKESDAVLMELLDLKGYERTVTLPSKPKTTGSKSTDLINMKSELNKRRADLRLKRKNIPNDEYTTLKRILDADQARYEHLAAIHVYPEMKKNPDSIKFKKPIELQTLVNRIPLTERSLDEIEVKGQKFKVPEWIKQNKSKYYFVQLDDTFFYLIKHMYLLGVGADSIKEDEQKEKALALKIKRAKAFKFKIKIQIQIAEAESKSKSR